MRRLSIAESFLFFLLIVYGVGCGVSQSLMSLAGALAVAAALLLSFRSKPRLQVWGWTLVVYLLLNLCLRPWDARSPHTLGNIPLLAVPLCGWLWPRLSASFRNRQISWALGAAVAALVASVSFTFVQVVGRHGAGIGFLRNPIYLAYNLLSPLVFFSELWIAEGDRETLEGPRWLWLAGAATALLGILLAQSRMIWLVAVFYLAARLLPILARHFGRAWLILLPLLLGGAGLALYETQPVFREKIDRSLHSHDPSQEWRKVAWRYNFGLFREHPLFGVGPEKNGINVATMPQFAGHWQPGVLIFAHSLYLQALADSGAVGLVLLLFYFGFLARQNRACAWLCAAFLLAGLTENSLNNSKAAHPFFFYLLLSLLLWRPQNA